MGKRRFPDQPIVDTRKCKKHNAWKKVPRNHPEMGAICELCQLELDTIRKGTMENKPQVIIRKI